MEEYIKSILSKYNSLYVTIDNDNDLKIIYDLFKNNIVSDDNITSICSFYYGYYYQYVKKEYDLMKKYYLIAIDKGNSDAMCNLGLYYESIEKNYELMNKYYLMAIDKQNSVAMNNLGYYYQNIDKNYELMKKYYLMAIDKGNSSAMNNLGFYYKKIENNYELMDKYYLMAIKNNINIIYIIKNIINELMIYNNKNPNQIKNILTIIFNYDNREINDYMYDIYKDVILKTIKETLNENKEQKLIIEDLKYRPDGVGYQEAKEDFENKISILN